MSEEKRAELSIFVLRVVALFIACAIVGYAVALKLN